MRFLRTMTALRAAATIGRPHRLLPWKRRAYLALGVALAVAPVALGAASILVPWTAAFSVQARTEILQFRVGNQIVPRWYVEAGQLELDSGCRTPLEGQLQILSGATVNVTRRGKADIFVELTAKNATAAKLYDPAGEFVRDIPSGAVVRLKVPETAGTLAFPIVGAAVVGSEARAMTEGGLLILAKGAVQILGKSIVGNHRYAAGKLDLDPGDRFEASRDDGAPPLGYGVLRADGDPGVEIVLHAVADRARITRFGTDGYEVRASLWSRIENDPILQALAILLFTALPALGPTIKWLFNMAFGGTHR